jgi:hypothetical protein
LGLLGGALLIAGSRLPWAIDNLLGPVYAVAGDGKITLGAGILLLIIESVNLLKMRRIGVGEALVYLIFPLLAGLTVGVDGHAFSQLSATRLGAGIYMLAAGASVGVLGGVARLTAPRRSYSSGT